MNAPAEDLHTAIDSPPGEQPGNWAVYWQGRELCYLAGWNGAIDLPDGIAELRAVYRAVSKGIEAYERLQQEQARG